MGLDQVVWTPAIGGSGSDRYDLPAVVAGNAQHIIQAGDGSVFSSLPSIPQINISSHFNQVIGLTRRRVQQYNTAFGTSLYQPVVIVPTSNRTVFAVTAKKRTANICELTTGSTDHGLAVGNMIKVTINDSAFDCCATIESVPTTTTLTYRKDGANSGLTAATGTLRATEKMGAQCVQNIVTAITALRAFEGFPTFSFPVGLTQDLKIQGVHLTKLRQALGLFGILRPKPFDYNPLVLNNIAFVEYEHVMPSVGPDTENFGGGDRAGKELNQDGDGWLRRLISTRRIPSWLTASIMVSATQKIPIFSHDFTLESFTAELWSAASLTVPTLLPSFNGTAYDLNSLEGDFDPSVHIIHSIPIALSNLASHAGAYFTLILGSDLELSGTGETEASAGIEESVLVLETSSDYNDNSLEIDLGS